MADKTEISENSDKQDSKNIIEQIKKKIYTRTFKYTKRIINKQLFIFI